MPRRRVRKTNRKRQEERRLSIRAVRLDSPEPKKLSRAFIALALARAEADAQAQAKKTRRVSGRDNDGADAGDGADDGAE